jgi:hypothetical protein
MAENKIITLHGLDGCGKTSVAQILHQELMLRGADTLLVGSSDYSQWMTPTICSRFIGSTDRFFAGTASGADELALTSLYEDIAVCLFGLAREHAATRGPVIVHSDPYLKRLVWARKAYEENTFWSYADNFDSYMSGYVDDAYSSDVVTINTNVDDALGRIEKRGIVSLFDPSNHDEAIKLDDAVQFVNREILAARRYPRLRDVNTIEITNPAATEHELSERLSNAAHEIGARILGGWI